MACPFCDITASNPTHVRSYTYWHVLVSLQQHTLGCLVVSLKRHARGLADVELAELFELRRVIGEADRTLRAAFGCAHVNYLFLNDRVPHLKCHVVPRYDGPVEFNRQVWRDDNFGHRPHFTAIEASTETLQLIRQKIERSWQE